MDESIEEEAKAKAQQRFMGMGMSHNKVKSHEPEVAKVAKNMKKKDAEDFAQQNMQGSPNTLKLIPHIRLGLQPRIRRG